MTNETDSVENFCLQLEQLYKEHNLGGYCLLISPNVTRAVVILPEWSLLQLQQAEGEDILKIESTAGVNKDLVENKIFNTLYFFRSTEDFLNHLSGLILDFVPKFLTKFEKRIEKLVAGTMNDSIH